jgi:hypothetical protein
MNRLILIGNGFDLAHGLKTSYADFILWYCENRIQESLSSDSEEVKDLLCTFRKRNNSVSILNQIHNLRQREKKTEDIDEIIRKIINTGLAKLENPFFKNIFDTLSNKGWVDIENAYYSFLFPFDEARNPLDQNKFFYKKNPELLNKELGYIRFLLIEYLDSIQKEYVMSSIIRPEIDQKIHAPIREKDIAVNSRKKWIEMLQQRVNYSQENFFKPDRIMMVNFNYTTLADMYSPHNDSFSVNHIHGILSKPEGVIFGYGDEMDENYKKLSNKNDNEYLRNIKSIKYLETDNYRNLLEFVESDYFQIFIMGHSCGNSDRTLLNTLFEHENCVSIKPFYHVFEKERDNYMEIVQNISRSFTDKTLMRDRVVNKSFCETI